MHLLRLKSRMYKIQNCRGISPSSLCCRSKLDGQKLLVGRKDRPGGTHRPPESQLWRPDLPKGLLWHKPRVAWAASNSIPGDHLRVRNCLVGEAERSEKHLGVEGAIRLGLLPRGSRKCQGGAVLQTARRASRMHENFPDLVIRNSGVICSLTSESTDDLPSLSVVPGKQESSRMFVTSSLPTLSCSS